MQSARTVLAAVLVGCLLTTGGCAELITGDGPAKFAASEASVGDAALSQSGFEHTKGDWKNVSREVSVVGQNRTIHASSYYNAYTRTASDGETTTSAFAVAATPQIKLAGQAFSPVGDWTERDVVDELEGNFGEYGSVSDVQRTGSHTVTVLGSSTEVVHFAATAEVDGRSVDVTIYVTRLEDGDDYVIAGGVHLAGVEGGQDRIDALLEGIEH